MIGPALVEAQGKRTLEPAFGRFGFRVLWSTDALPSPEALVERFTRAAHGKGVHVQGWSVDEPGSAARSATAETLAEAVSSALPDASRISDASAARQRGGVLAQLCAAGPALWIIGVVPAIEAVTLAPGGRRRMRRAADAPSRASMKLDEALVELGHEPGRGDLCVDLGAAPGGWVQRLVERGAKVLAVDPANLRPELSSHRQVRHFKESAFSFEPEEPVDWLFCDMAWRPLEVAQLLAKWSRRRWATHLVANIKLPMQDKNPILLRIRHTLEEGGWRNLRMRQLYHDRDEVTVMARRTE